MLVSRRCKKFHDPWGNKFHNRCGSPIRHQYMVSKAELHTATVSRPLSIFDKSKQFSHQYDRFVHGAYSVEAIRR